LKSNTCLCTAYE